MSFFTKLKIVLLLLISVLLFYLTSEFLNSYQIDQTVLVAAVDINEREIIKPEMLLKKNVRERERFIIAPKSAKNPKDLIGTLTKTKIPAGKVIDTVEDVIKVDGTSVALNNFGETFIDPDVSQSYFIKPNQRLVAIKLESENSLSNKLQKGDIVDVIGSYQDKYDAKITLVIAQHVEVHDVAKISKEEKGKEAQNIVLKLGMQQAGDAIWMKNNGQVDLLLSSVNSKSEVSTPITEVSIFNRVVKKMN
jgi:pilus assembly protein CpaB